MTDCGARTAYSTRRASRGCFTCATTATAFTSRSGRSRDIATSAHDKALTGVVAALRAERIAAAPLARAGWGVARGGIGPRAARKAAEALLADGCRRLLVWGMAGALVAELRSGALLLAREVIVPDGRRYACDVIWRAHLHALLSGLAEFAEANLASASEPMGSAAAKRSLATATGAVAVDMEAGAVAELASERGVPFAVLRVVADPLELEIPPAVVAAMRSRFLGPAVALRLLTRPGDLPAVLRLAEAHRAARRTLMQAALTIAARAHATMPTAHDTGLR